EYEVVKSGAEKGEIRRVSIITPKEKGMKQKLTLKKKYGEIINESPQVMKQLGSLYNSGKYVLNLKAFKYGIIEGFYPNNNKDKMRYCVLYVDLLETKNHKLGTTAWDYDKVEVFENIQDLIYYI